MPDGDRDDRNDRYRKYVDAASVLGQITRARAEEMVRDMLSGSEEQRAHVQQRVDDLIDRSRRMTEGLIDLVRGEVTHQLHELGLDPEDLARQAADILRKYAGGPVSRRRASGRAAGGTATPPRTAGGQAATAGPATKAAAKKAPAKRGSVQKAAAKKAPAKKAPAKKSPAKKSAAKKTAAAKKGARRAAESTR